MFCFSMLYHFRVSLARFSSTADTRANKMGRGISMNPIVYYTCRSYEDTVISMSLQPIRCFVQLFVSIGNPSFHSRLTVPWLVSSCIVAESKGLGGLTMTPGSSSSEMTSSFAFRLVKMTVEASARPSSVSETVWSAETRRVKESLIIARALRVVSVAEGRNRRRVGVGGTEMTRSASSSVASSEEPTDPLRWRPIGCAEPG